MRVVEAVVAMAARRELVAAAAVAMVLSVVMELLARPIRVAAVVVQ
jgi:hypothetical protein